MNKINDIRMDAIRLLSSDDDIEERAGALTRWLMMAQEKGKYEGRVEFKAEVLAALRGTLDRDPTMQKVVEAIEGM